MFELPIIFLFVFQINLYCVKVLCVQSGTPELETYEDHTRIFLSLGKPRFSRASQYMKVNVFRITHLCVFFYKSHVYLQ